jgi:hypothetical protein
MSYTWATTSRGHDDEEGDLNPLSCAVWDSDDPCACVDLRDLTTAERLDLIHPAALHCDGETS